MNFKSLIEQLDQLSEVTKETPTGRVHTAEPGGYGRQYDTDEEGTETQMPVEPVQKRGRGRPKLGSDKFGNVPKYEFAKQLQDFMVGNLPGGKLPGKPGKKHKISDKEVSNEAMVVTDDNGNPVAEVSDANTANQVEQAMKTGRIKPVSEYMKEAEEKWIQKAIKTPGAFTKKAKSHGMTPSEFSKEVLSNKEKYPASTEKQANLAKTLSKISKEKTKESVAEGSYINGRQQSDDELVWKQTSLSMADAIAKFGKENVKIEGENRLGKPIVLVKVSLVSKEGVAEGLFGVHEQSKINDSEEIVKTYEKYDPKSLSTSQLKEYYEALSFLKDYYSKEQKAGNQVDMRQANKIEKLYSQLRMIELIRRKEIKNMSSSHLNEEHTKIYNWSKFLKKLAPNLLNLDSSNERDAEYWQSLKPNDIQNLVRTLNLYKDSDPMSLTKEGFAKYFKAMFDLYNYYSYTGNNDMVTKLTPKMDELYSLSSTMMEAEMPTFDSIAGAGLGAGRSKKVLENDQQLVNKYGPIPAQELEQLKKQAHKNAVEAEPTGFGPRYDLEYKTTLEKLLADRKSVKESKKAKPDFLDLDKDGNKKESMKSAAKQAKLKKKKIKEGLPLALAAGAALGAGRAVGAVGNAIGSVVDGTANAISGMFNESFENWDKQLSQLLSEDLSISMTKSEDNVPTSFNINVSGENVEDFLPIIKKLSAMSDITDSEVDSHAVNQINMGTYTDNSSYGDMAGMIGKMDYLDSDYKDEDQHGEMNVCEVCHEQACRCDEEMLVDEESHDMMQESYANSTDDAYQTDEEFLINTISSGLNKKKSTGQSTIPVVASQTDRLVDSIDDWVKLSGIKK